MKTALAGALAIVLGLLAACSKDRTYPVNEKLTVHVSTPTGPVSSSGIVQRTYTYWPDRVPLTDTEITATTVGEALVLRLDADRQVFALLRRGGEVIAYGAFAAERANGSEALLKRMSTGELRGEVRPVPRRFWPELIAFRDIGDPATAYRVGPDDLFPDQSGRHAVTAVTVEIVEDGPAMGRITGLLPWLKDLGLGALDGQPPMTRGDQPVANRLYRADFTSEPFDRPEQ